MTIRANVVKITGTPSADGWSQAYECDTRKNGSKKPELLLVVFSTIKNGTSSENAELGKRLLQDFQSEYFSDPARSSDLSLKIAVKKTFDRFFQNMDGLEIAAISFSDGRLFTSCINGGKASLYRDKFLVKILDSNSPQTISASGFPKIGDIIILATSSAYEKLSYSEIKETFTKSLSEAEDLVSTKIHDIPTASCALIGFFEREADIAGEGGLDESTEKNLQEIKNGGFKIKLPSGVFSGIFNKIRNLLRRRIYIKKEKDPMVEPVKNKMSIFVGIILVVVLAISVIFGLIKNKNDEYKKSYEGDLSHAISAMQEAVSLKEIDIKRAREQFLTGRRILALLQEREIKDENIDELAVLVSENEKEILGEKTVESEIWLDLTLVKDDFNSEMLLYSEDTLYVSDMSQKTIITLDIDTKRSTTIKIPDEIKEVKRITVKAGEIFILAEDGIYEMSDNKKMVERNWGFEVFLATFGTNIYILDQGKGEILKSSGVESGYSEAKKWTTSEREDFSDVRSFVVDGFAWVLTSGGVEKFSYGNNLRFELKNYPYDIPQYERLYTSEDAENLYLLDKEGKLISVFDKEGGYKYNIISDVVGEAKDLIVSESEGKIILLTGGKLYEIKI